MFIEFILTVAVLLSLFIDRTNNGKISERTHIKEKSNEIACFFLIQIISQRSETNVVFLLKLLRHLIVENMKLLRVTVYHFYKILVVEE